MVTITRKELEIDKELKNKIEFICSFCNTTPTIINGNIRKINKTNLNYIEPHRIIIKGVTFLVFNYSNEIFIENLSNRIKLSELFEKLFDEDDASSESEFFDSQEAKRILNQARKDEYNLEKIDKILEPFAKIAKKQLEALQHYERDKNVER